MLLKVDQLSVSYPNLNSFFRNQKTPIVNQVSFDIQAGEILGLVGGSGCGKSTLSRCITGLLPKLSGQIIFDGAPLMGTHPEIQMIFQDPTLSLNPRLSIVNNIIESIRYSRPQQTKKERIEHIEQLMLQVGLNPEHLMRFPHEFSGGQLQRIGIARALASNPKLIICDEPVSALDISIQAQILNLLKSLQKKLGLALLFVTHDLAVVRYISDRCMVMHKGEIVESGPTENLIQNPQHPITQKLILCAHTD
jgi:oligopeptide transport system ATP-binding protein